MAETVRRVEPAVGGRDTARMWASATWSVPGFVVLAPLVAVVVASLGDEDLRTGVYGLPLALLLAVALVVRRPSGVVRGLAGGFLLAVVLVGVGSALVVALP